MHAMGDVIDMRRFSGLRQGAADHALDVPVRRRWRWPGFPLLSGFWSKDEILAVAARRQRTHGGRTAASTSLLFVVAPGHGGADGVLHVPRLLPDVLGRRNGSRRRPGHHAHESPPVDDRGRCVHPGRRAPSASAWRRRAGTHAASPSFLASRRPGAAADVLERRTRHRPRLAADAGSARVRRPGAASALAYLYVRPAAGAGRPARRRRSAAVRAVAQQVLPRRAVRG